MPQWFGRIESGTVGVENYLPHFQNVRKKQARKIQQKVIFFMDTHTYQLLLVCIIYKLAAGALYPIKEISNEDVKDLWPQCLPP